MKYRRKRVGERDHGVRLLVQGVLALAVGLAGAAKAQASTEIRLVKMDVATATSPVDRFFDLSIGADGAVRLTRTFLRLADVWL